MKYAIWALVVVVIIGTIVLAYPSIRDGLRKLNYAPVKTRTRIAELSDGCYRYKQDYKYYPGQARPAEIGGGEGQSSGAQILARAMFTKVEYNGEVRHGVSNYATYREDELLDADGIRGLISDMYPHDPMPILYYPSRIAVSGMAQYVEADNAVHTDAHKGGDFHEFIKDKRFGTDHPQMDGEFLLIAPGADRKYFTEDDLTNWDR